MNTSLLLFAIASDVMRNDFLVLKYSYQRHTAGKKRTLAEINHHSLSYSFVIIRYHSLSLVVTCYTTCCHLLSLSVVCLFINDPRKTSTNEKKIFACALQRECSDEIENVQEKCGILLYQTYSLTLLKRYFIKDILLQNVSTFL